VKKEKDALGARWVEAPLDGELVQVFRRLFTRKRPEQAADGVASLGGSEPPAMDAESLAGAEEEGTVPAQGSTASLGGTEEVPTAAQGSLSSVGGSGALPMDAETRASESSQGASACFPGPGALQIDAGPMSVATLSSGAATSSRSFSTWLTWGSRESLGSQLSDPSMRDVRGFARTRAGGATHDLVQFETFNPLADAFLHLPGSAAVAPENSQQLLGGPQYHASALSSESAAWLMGQNNDPPALQTFRLAEVTDHGDLAAAMERPGLPRWTGTRKLPSVPEGRRAEVPPFHGAHAGTQQGILAAPRVEAENGPEETRREGIAPAPNGPVVAYFRTDQASPGAMAAIGSLLPQDVRALYYAARGAPQPFGGALGPGDCDLADDFLQQQLQPLGASRVQNSAARGGQELGETRMNSERSEETRGSGGTSMSCYTSATFSVPSDADMSLDAEKSRAHFSARRT
jgi:hypothetical protein